MRLIDADELLEELDTLFQYHKDHINIHPFVASLATELTLSVIDKVKAAPAIEARKKGKWKEVAGNYYCPFCDTEVDYICGAYISQKIQFCPHCGAEMEDAE